MMMTGSPGEAAPRPPTNCIGFREHESLQYSQIQCLLYVQFYLYVLLLHYIGIIFALDSIKQFIKKTITICRVQTLSSDKPGN